MRLTILKKLLAIMFILAIIPLGILGYVSVNNAKDIGFSAIEDAKLLGQNNLQSAHEIGSLAIEKSSVALDEKSIEFIELRAYEVAQSVTSFLRERESDVIYASALPRSVDEYERFLNTKFKEVWEKEDEKMDRPIYTEMVFYNLNGVEELKLVYNKVSKQFVQSSELKDISLPENTEYLQETYFEDSKNLMKEQIYLSDLAGWVLPLSESFLGKDRPEGKRYEGIYRWITPVYSGNNKIGFVMLSMDQEHVNQYVDNLNPVGSHEWAMPASTGNYGYLIAHDSWVTQHPKDFYIRGFLPDGSLAEGYGGPVVPELVNKVKEGDILGIEEEMLNPSEEELAIQLAHSGEQKAQGFIPLYGAWLTFATGAGFPELVFMNHRGEHGSNIYDFEGKTKFVAMSTIMYGSNYGDKVVNLKTDAGFGFVGMGANLPDFHAAATSTAEDIKAKTDAQGQQIGDSIERTKQKILDQSRTLSTNNIIVLVVLIIVVILVTSIFAKSISKPIRELKDAADKVTSGEDAKLPTIKGTDEVAELTGSMEMLITAFKAKTGKK